jgi:ketosteroid isomerase-like protein
MKTRNIRWTCTILALGALALPIFASADVKSEVTAAYNAATKKYAAKDIDGLFKTCTPDVTFKMSDGKTYNAAQSKALMKEQLASMKNIKVAAKVDSFTSKGNTATFTATETTDATMAGSDKKSHKFHMVGKYKYTVVKNGGAWKLKTLETLTEAPMKDGKPMTGPP